MKDIIRQAVADAAKELFCEFGESAAFLAGCRPEWIIRFAKGYRAESDQGKRVEQLADFVVNPVQGAETAAVADQLRDEDLWSLRRPVIDSVLIAGPEGEIARTGGFVGRCHTVKLRQDGSLSNDSMTVQVGRLDFDFGLQERCADAARFLFDQGYDYALDSVQGLLTSLSPAALIRDAHAFGYNGPAASKSGRDFNKEVLLPAPKDPMWSVPVTVTYDGAEGEGRVWLSTQEDDEPMIAIEGRENAATLAGMLIDWVQPDVVVVPRALLERLKDISRTSYDLDTEYLEAIKAITDLL